jgi:hypothetical protein
MKSKITIEIDFENGNQPIIQILHRKSDDVRDKLLQSFIEKFDACTSWCQIKWLGESLSSESPESFQKIVISPLLFSQLKEQSQIMSEQYELNKEYRNKL